MPSRIEDFRFLLPSLPEQRDIAHILGTLDDKIELNRRMNATLEEMARALFRSWFVDFDPVRAKSEGRQPAGMDAATAALFPDSFEETVLGEVPAGWQPKPLDDVASFLNGLALQRFPARGGDYLPVIKIAEMRKGITEASGRAAPNIDKRYVIQDGDVLFSWSGSLDVCVWTGGVGALNQHLFKVTSSTYPKWFYLQWVKHHLSHFQRIAAGKATTMGHIQRRHLTETVAIVPPSAILPAMTILQEPLLDLWVANAVQSRHLVTTRDMLLPKLLSGEIRVEEAVRVVAEVG